MSKNPRIPTDEAVKMDDTQPKIMTQPLPMILDELENYIRRVEEAVKQSQAAARESREAAAQAKLSGEKAAQAAQKAAEAAVEKVRQEAARAADALSDRINEVSENLANLEDRVKQEAISLDEAFLALKDRHIEQSPFFEN
jgi:flagellar biosynthesis/type III secretory pathway protein FliH